jgi:hypothetical protein
MKRIAELAGRELRWGQPSALRMEYELREGEELIATLRFRSSFGTLATAESGDGCWTFKRVGFWQTRVSVRACGSESEIASFNNNTWSGGGTLDLPDGRRFLASTNFWQTRYDFRTETEQTLFRYARMGGLLHKSASVVMEHQSEHIPELPWMVILGFYLVVMMDLDAAAMSPPIA